MRSILLTVRSPFILLIMLGLSACIADVPGVYVKYKTISLETVTDPDDIRTYRIPIDNYDDYWTFPNGAAYIHIKAEVPGYEFIKGGSKNKQRKARIVISNLREKPKKIMTTNLIFIDEKVSSLKHFQRPICKFGYKYSYNTPVEEILKDCSGFDTVKSYYLTPELEDGRVNRIGCIINCTVKTTYNGVGITYSYSKRHLENWKDIDAKIMKIIDSYRK